MLVEAFGSGILGSIFGGLFRIAPEVLNWLDRKNERSHELEMFRLQTDLEKVRGEFRMEERYVEHSTAQLDAIQAAFREQSVTASASYPWVAAASALVRPMVTYVLFAMYVAFKVTVMVYALYGGASWLDVIKNNWTVEDFAMLNMVLTFWFVGRAIEKYRQ